MNYCTQSAKEQHNQRRDKTNNPSFSSTLLDAVYRSIDEGGAGCQEKHKTMNKTKHNSEGGGFGLGPVSGSVPLRRKSMADFEDAKSRLSCYSMQQQRPTGKLVRTSLSSSNPREEYVVDKQEKKENGFARTIKKVKQPISPGGKLASFINSIFNTSGSAKKSKRRSNSKMKKATKSGGSESSTTSSSASSFSRSCLSKSTTTSSSSTSGNDNLDSKRSVSFGPVSTVTVDEDCPCPAYREKILYQTTRDLLNKYKKNEHEFEDEEDDDDDAASYASSDLFELDNLSFIGIDQKRYREELPVYGTTHVDTNLAIAKGLIV